ncbi:Ig-like domain-containing protein [Bacillus sp. AFS017336]|uniref:Ig-like domain-containing protein n=1 Tax=Bacillus sp. AFS017336 TaxID=2033489 RepID=UPI0015CF15DA|nr:Ig-like domain-containing protein [Bacillus sp. AFS017336]
MSKRNFKKNIAKTTISALVATSLVPFNVFAAAPNTSTDQTTTHKTVAGSFASDASAANLTKEQREILNQLKTTSGETISPNIDTTTSKPVRVIVEFKQAPAKISVLQKAVEGESTTLSAENSAVKESHTAFKTFVNGLNKSVQPAGVSALTTTGTSESAADVTITREYTHALNGVAMTLPGNMVETLFKSGVVNRILNDDIVKLDPSETKISTNEASPSDYPENYIPLPGIDGLRKDGITGQGINVGVIDTGVDYNHPDLTTVYKGYRAKQGEDASKVDPTSVKGWDFVDNDADPMETTIDDWKTAGEPDGTYEHYITYHGTHVSGTIAAQSKASVEFPAQGVAPGVNLYDYRVLGPYGHGYTEAIIGGIDKAVADGMKVINMSLGAANNDPLSAEAIAVNNATLAGVTCVISAGNSGPSEGTLGTPGASALAITVGASDFAMSIPTASAKVGNASFTNFKLLGKGYAGQVSDLANKTYEFVDVGLAQADDFKDGSGNPIDLTGKVALISRGTNNLNDKIMNSKKAGAVAAIMTNNIDGDIDNYLGTDESFITTFRMTKADGERLRADGSHSITFTSTGATVSEGNHLASFSSRGPVATTYDIKPDIVAPGVSVYSTYPYFVHSPGKVDYTNAYARISGTSMASPHVAGIAALILQAHPDYKPADVKAALTNSAGKLNGNYSVYEQGAGLVDVAKAVKNDVSFKVQDTTESAPNSGVNLDYEKGSLTFGSIYRKEAGTSNSGNRTVKVTNRGNKTKTFDITAEYNKPNDSVNNAVSNGVTVTANGPVTVEGGKTANFTATVNIPASAAYGRYEGYVIITNHDDPTETYRIPFAVRSVEKGIGRFGMDLPATRTNNPIIYSDFNGTAARAIKFRFNSPMKYAWVVVYDKAGNPLGSPMLSPLSISGYAPDKDIFTTLDFSTFYPFIGDPKKELTSQFTKTKLPEGEYTLKLRATDTDNLYAKTYEMSQNFIIDNTLPILTYKDHAPGVYELEDKDFTDEKMNGDTYHAFWVHTNLSDEGTAKLAEFGATQADNYLWYYHNDLFFPEGDFPIEANGDAKFGIEKSDIEKGPQTITLFPMDVAHNAELLNDFHQYGFVKKGTPYMVPSYDKQKATLNDTVTMTLSLNNVKDMLAGTYEAAYYHDYFDLQGVTVNPAFKKWADEHGVTVNVDPVVKTVDIDYPTHVSDINVGAHLSGGADFKGFSGNSPFLNVSFKVKDDNWDILAARFTHDDDTTKFRLTQYGQENPTEITAFSRLNGFQLLPTHNSVQTYVKLAGLQNNFSVKLDSVGAKGYAQMADGSIYPGVIDEKGYIDIKGMPVSKDPFKVIVEGPGHLKSIQSVTLGKTSPWGDLLGEFKFVAGQQTYAAAGDINGDGVIDVLDVKAVAKKYSVKKTAPYNVEDLNKDGIVDSQDMNYLVNNLYKANPDNTISPKEMVDGKYATDYFNALGIVTSINTFKVVDSGSHKATFTWNPAVDATAIKIQVNNGSGWTTATTETPLAVNDGKATVTGLSENTAYQFRVSMTGGLNPGSSNAVSLTTSTVPTPNAPVVKGLGNGDSKITGKADPNVNITVKAGETIVASGKANEAGDFSLSIAKQTVGTVLSITAKNDDNKVSPVTSITVSDNVAPDEPVVDKVGDSSKTVTGKAEAGSTVVVRNNDGVLGSAKADANGNYSVTITPQKAGTTLYVSSTDTAGNASKDVTVSVTDTTAPTAPVVNTVTDHDTQIAGTVEGYGTVTVKADGKVIGTEDANKAGKFYIGISPLAGGTELTVTVSDAAGNVSAPTTVKVLDKTAPSAPIINPIADNESVITGKTEANATVTVKNGNTEIGTGNADSNGVYAIQIGKQTAGTILTVTAKDPSGNESAASNTTVLDKTAPNTIVINPIGDNETVLTGKTEANATVTVKNGNSEIGSGKADSNGLFEIEVGKQTAGTILTVTAKDSAGNVSEESTTTVIDKTAPATLVIHSFSDNDTELTGSTEAGATVIVKNGNKVIGTGKAYSNGYFVVQVGKQAVGTVLSVTAKDQAGNESNVFDVVVLDKTAPAVPVVNAISDKDATLTGKAEANATITVKVGNNVIGSGKADSNGSYQIQVGKLKAGTTLTVTATDQSGNVSGASNTTVLDKTAPTAPVINAIDDNDLVITGKAEVNATITIKNGTKVIGTGKADSNGTYKIALSKQTAGTVLTVTAKDAAGNESTASKTTVLDKTAPSVPAITSVSVSSKTGIQVNGKAEANAKIVISIGTKVVANVNASSNGTFAAKLPKQNAGKLTITIYAVDKAGNKSGTVSRQVTVK